MLKKLQKWVLENIIDLDGGTWMGLFSWVALVRFTLGLAVDSTLYLGILAAFAASTTVQKIKGAQ